MGIAVAIVAVVLVVAGFVWVMLQPTPDTEMGRENKARKEAKKAQKKGLAGTDETDATQERIE